MDRVDVLLIFVALVLVLGLSIRMTAILTGGTGAEAHVAQQITASAPFFQVYSSPKTDASRISSFSSTPPPVSSLITENEITQGPGFNSNQLQLEEKFTYGNISQYQNSNQFYCSSDKYIGSGYIGTCYFNGIPYPCEKPGKIETKNYSYVVGYIGYPVAESSPPLTCYDPIPPSGTYDFPNIISAVVSPLAPGTPYTCLPPAAPYPNFFNWSANNTLFKYTGSGGNYYYAINNSFNTGGYTSSHTPIQAAKDSSIIIPAISCGSSFPLSSDYNSLFDSLYYIESLSGFTPSIGLASFDHPGYLATYIISLSGPTSAGWPVWSNDAFLVYKLQLLSQETPHTNPAIGYAKFPAGNAGDSQYINVSSFFNTSIDMQLDSSSSSPVGVYISNTSVMSFLPPQGSGYYGLDTTQKFNEMTQSSSVSGYTLPNLNAGYYPEVQTGTYGLFLYDYFKTGVIFPFCGLEAAPNIFYSNCTFEDPNSVNHVSYQRYWDGNMGTTTAPVTRTSPSTTTESENLQFNYLDLQPFSPANDSSQLNAFTQDALDSMCFFGENFSTVTGVYTPPSYTRIVPPTSAENYTSDIGKCNAFFNSSNCFSPQYNNLLNFKDGIFSSGLACTPSGITSKVTDAWINSIFIANNAGQYCGLFDGKKSLSDPVANSTTFLQKTYDCPSFSSNSSYASLVITVKNVGTQDINDPYLVVLFRDTNATQMFYSSNSGNSEIQNYGLYTDFISQIQHETTGVIEVRYNKTFQTDMYVYKPGFPLNPIPIQSLFSAPYYENGPYNNSLLGLWMYYPSSGKDVIRTANTFLVHSDSNNTQLPLIIPNGTATFTVEIPMPLFEALLAGRFNMSVFFGNLFNVSWASGSGVSNNPTNTIGTGFKVDPLVASGQRNGSYYHNNEVLSPSGMPSPTWQYIVSYENTNFSTSPFQSSTVYFNNFNVSLTAANNTQNSITATVSTDILALTGSGLVNLTYESKNPYCTTNPLPGQCKAHPTRIPNPLSGSSVSCFASQDNLNDFSVFWLSQAASSPNIKYATQAFYNYNSTPDNILITRWRGLLFMPYSDSVGLSFNNIPAYQSSIASFQLEKPEINSSIAESNRQAFVYLGNGSLDNILSNTSHVSSALSSNVTLTYSGVPIGSYGFALEASNIFSNRSLLKIVGYQNLQNTSTYSGNPVIVTLSDGSSCSFSGTTNGSGVLSSDSLSPSISSSGCLSNIVINNTVMKITSKVGPFNVELYNDSNLNLSNETYGGTAPVSSNITNFIASSSGTYSTTLNISGNIGKGFSLLFSFTPSTRYLKDSKLFLYYLNDTPFSCNIENSVPNTPIADVGASQVSNGEYLLENGTIICYLNKSFQAIRAVFINDSNNAYLGSGDIGLGQAVQSQANNELYITEDDLPLNSQDVNLSAYGQSSVGCGLYNQVISDGFLNYTGKCTIEAGGNYSINFTQESGGQEITKNIFLPSIPSPSAGAFLIIDPSAAADSPTAEENLSIPYTSPPAPVVFSMPKGTYSCQGIKVVTNSPYPYSELPFQTLPNIQGDCSYVFVSRPGVTNYMILEGTPPPLNVSVSWINLSQTPYSVGFAYSNYSGTIESDCKSGFGPCISDFNINGNDIGTLLFNNVSSSSPVISESGYGPVAACFDVSYTSSQTAVWKETGFGNINYDSNKLYQTTSPSQNVVSIYCVYDGSNVITDQIQTSGPAIDFNIQNNLIDNFSYAAASTGQVASVSPPISVGYLGYNTVTVQKEYTKNGTAPNPSFVNSCTTTVTTSGTESLVNITSSDINPKAGPQYCLYSGSPTYTEGFSSPATSSSNLYNAQSGETVGFLYKPGNFSANDGTLYDACSISGQTPIPGEGPELFVNGSYVQYQSSNPSENYIVSHTASIGINSILYLPSNQTFIDSCPINDSVYNYTSCIKPAPPVMPQAGSYDSIEAIPESNPNNYNYSSNGVYTGTNYPIGGGCFVGDINNIQYSCAPTNGTLSFSSSSPKKASSLSVSLSSYLFNSSSAPTKPLQPSFSCSGWFVSSSNTNTSFSCTYPSTSGNCEASFSSSPISSSENNLTGTCSITASGVKSDSIEISDFSINTKQSESTYLLSNYTCGNSSALIEKNVQSEGWTWQPGTTFNTINPSGIPEVGGCEAGRDAFNVTAPTITTNPDGNSQFYQTYSCPTGYSGSILSCSSNYASGTISTGVDFSCVNQGTAIYITSSTDNVTVSGPQYGSTPTGCNSFSSPGYYPPTLSNKCIAYHYPASLNTNASFVVQYDNRTSLDTGVGFGIISTTLPLNVSIPSGYFVNPVRDDYFTSLSVSQQELINLVTQLYPADLLISNNQKQSLSESSFYPYDMLNTILLQNPYFGISGIPGFVNGSVFDYAMNIFTGGTSQNCLGSKFQGDYGLFNLGEGQLCSGQSLPPEYSNGLYFSLGQLNSGLHAIQFYSISENGSTSPPSVQVFDSVSNAVQLNSTCPNGSPRIFTSTYPGRTKSWSFNITYDEGCNQINNLLYGYVINCIYQSPGNSTYSVRSQYYRAYNLPTVWNISYTLLVSPKSYNIVPVRIYQIKNPVSSFLSIYKPTTFIETGIPQQVLSVSEWGVDYGGNIVRSNISQIYTLSNGNNDFTVLDTQNSSSGCTTVYTPSPVSGVAPAAGTVNINFSNSTSCVTTFTESGLPAGTQWNVTYDSILNLSSTSTITVESPAGSYSFSVPTGFVVSGTCYVASPASGSLTAGGTQNIAFSASSDCSAVFSESGILNTQWSVTYDGVKKTSLSGTITFLEPQGTYSFLVPVVSEGGCKYSPSPSSGSLSTGSTQKISFSGSGSCTSYFKETGVPSGHSWTVTYDFQTHSSTSSTISFSSIPAGTHSFSVPIVLLSCSSGQTDTTEYRPSPSSGSLTAGGTQSIKFTGVRVPCVTT
ncbi:hypothetical protein M1293_01900 [Candidatus Parvarchaeota archaeon]|nr:hypothetical protein [Candidatus Parvarchaeota archaeon]